jgi:crotonobetainyl-CoA:carnitine CoA-transferase CaiB-like acyl-CoA transferase
MVEKKLLLNSPRVLDLTEGKGFICARLLADLGADVIKIERPGGDPARKIGPFFHNNPDPDKSLYWLAYNTNKRGITLNIESTEGQQLFRKMAAKADFVIESFAPGYLDGLKLGYSDLKVLNPHLIYTSITPYGQTGPYKDYKATDLEVMAMSGMMYITGTPDAAPLRISFPQSDLIASAHAAAASMVAYYYRETSGFGQYVDVSSQECVLWEISNAIPLWELNQIILKRAGSYLSGRWQNVQQKLLWQCADGFVVFYIIGGDFGLKTNRAMVAWMQEEGMAPDYLSEFDWNTFDMSRQTQESLCKFEAPIADFFKRHTKEELYSEALKRKIMLCPVCTAGDINENSQLKARNFWVELDHPELDAKISYPGPFAKLSETPLIMNLRAPQLGEHNNAIYGQELGISEAELQKLQQSGVI